LGSAAGVNVNLSRKPEQEPSLLRLWNRSQAFGSAESRPVRVLRRLEPQPEPKIKFGFEPREQPAQFLRLSDQWPSDQRRIVRDPGPAKVDKLVLIYMNSTCKSPREAFAKDFQTDRNERRKTLIALVAHDLPHRLRTNA
uniref:Thioredoxin-like_fold domain-containing protein n=1 Tax=Toxocara canis TaxID=6265 RepID=A0A183VES4_TOXCA